MTQLPFCHHNTYNYAWTFNFHPVTVIQTQSQISFTLGSCLHTLSSIFIIIIIIMVTGIH